MLQPFHYYGVAEYLTEDEKQSPKVHRIGTADGDASDSSSRHHLEEWLEGVADVFLERYGPPAPLVSVKSTDTNGQGIPFAVG